MSNVYNLRPPESAPTLEEWVAAGLGPDVVVGEPVTVAPTKTGAVLQFARKQCKDWNTTLPPEHLLGLAEWFNTHARDTGDRQAAWHFTALWVAARHPAEAPELQPFVVNRALLWEYCYWNEVDVWGVKP